MYYRRKILLALLQTFDHRLEKLRLQKLLFLLARLQKENTVYDFVPYKFGCFSFQAMADLGTLKKYGIIEEQDNQWIKADFSDYLGQIKQSDRLAMKTLHSLYGSMSTSDLIRYTYEKFPYYAINSTITEKYVSKEVAETIFEQIPMDNDPILFTIGYEGKSLETYLNTLLKHNVKVLCDVRKNAQSMKYGFSKKQLQNACEGTGIKYIHFPEVGIVSESRTNLNTQADYDRLFEEYKNENLKDTLPTQNEIFDLIKSHKRIALTCFEANINQCHRKSLAESIAHLPGFDYEIKHL